MLRLGQPRSAVIKMIWATRPEAMADGPWLKSLCSLRSLRLNRFSLDLDR